MLTNNFITDGLFTTTKTVKGSELNRYCRLEGMDYQQLVSESSGAKSLLGKFKQVHGTSQSSRRIS